jgi:hypothetical protein
MTKEEFAKKDTDLRHAVQTGVAYLQQYSENVAFYTNNPSLARILKHLQTGLCCAMCEHATILKLLIDKGLITEAEYFEAALKTLSEEVKRHEETLSSIVGASIKLA